MNEEAASPNAFASRDYRRFFATRIVYGLAYQMNIVALGWLVYSVTESAFALGMVGLFSFLPVLLASLVSGHVADQYDRRLITMIGHSVLAICSLGLLLCAQAGESGLPYIYALAGTIGLARAFSNPASQALMPTLVPRAALGNAISWNSSAWQTSAIVGPALGGLFYALGPVAVFGSTTVMFVAATLLIGSISMRRPKDMAREPHTLETALAGFRFIRSRPVIFGAISLDLFAVLLGGATALMPIFAKDILQTGPWGLGLLRSSVSLGGVFMALALARWPLKRQAGPRMLWAVVIFGLATIVFGLSTEFWLSMAALFVMGAADMISVYVRQTLVQGETPDGMRGRVSAVSTVFIGASNELGEFESGMLAAAVGAVPAVVIGGVGTIAVVGLWAWLFPDLRKRDHLIPEKL
jgi:MFS family permease